MRTVIWTCPWTSTMPTLPRQLPPNPSPGVAPPSAGPYPFHNTPTNIGLQHHYPRACLRASPSRPLPPLSAVIRPLAPPLARHPATSPFNTHLNPPLRALIQLHNTTKIQMPVSNSGCTWHRRKSSMKRLSLASLPWTKRRNMRSRSQPPHYLRR